MTDRDGLTAAPEPLSPFACALREAGLRIVRHRLATADDVVALHSTWAKRLGIPARRPAWLLVARKPGADAPR